jgi:hypothetical protein
MSPSDLPFWAWLLCALGCLVIGIAFVIAGRDGNSRVVVALGLLVNLAALACAAIGIILFVKWVWTS